MNRHLPPPPRTVRWAVVILRTAPGHDPVVVEAHCVDRAEVDGCGVGELLARGWEPVNQGRSPSGREWTLRRRVDGGRTHRTLANTRAALETR